MQTLAECLNRYKVYLEEQLAAFNRRQDQPHPARTVGTDISVEYRAKCAELPDKYSLFDQVVKEADELTPILFDESLHLHQPFESSKQRQRFFKNMHLTSPVDLYKYCPGGSVVTVVFAAKVPEDRSEKEKFVHPLNVISKISDRLPEYHTRCQKKQFREKILNITNMKPGIIDYIYKELALDASVANNPEMQQRLRMISLGETGLVADMRELNTGKSVKFDTFFQKLEEVVEGVTAVDDRRHGEAHLSRWISLKELIQQAVEKCPEGTLIPSKSLVRLQFTPRNPYAHSAMNFTSRVPVQYKIQRRQLRASHVDQHFCAAQFKYMKEKAVELDKEAILFCCDDKAKIPVGEPGLPVSTGVRGRKSIAPTATTLVAADHDMTKASLCPSVYLKCQTPDSPERSFVRGKVNVVVNDSAFQMSNPFRHAVMMTKILQQEEKIPSVVLKFADGGTDQRNTLESVKCAAIYMFKELNLDLYICARCAPGNSWVNPAERVMSILNLGLQNCSLERKEDDGKFRSCNSLSQVRELVQKKPELRDAWTDCIEPIQSLVKNRFLRLTLKEEPFTVLDPATDLEIEIFQRHLRDLFPEMDISKLQKVHTRSVESYQKWLDVHCRQRQYTFQIRKCTNEACCIPPTVSEDSLQWLPDPVISEDKDHFKAYKEVKGTDTTDEARPSFMQGKQKKANQRRAPSTAQVAGKEADLAHASETTSSVFTAQNARFSCECVECRKPRVIYAKNRLTERQNTQLAILLSDMEYSCGSHITAPEDPLHGKIHIRLGLQCGTPVEIPYYSSDIGVKNLCCFCAAPNGEVKRDLRQKYKTVLPICLDCEQMGMEPVCQRPYGKAK